MLTVTQKATGLRLVLTDVLVHLLLLFAGIYKTGKKVFNFMGSGHCFAIYKKTYFSHKIECPFFILLDNGLIT
jgi:hypothetical protein